MYKLAKQSSKKVKLQDVRDWLRKQQTYTLHKHIRKKFLRRKTVVAGIDTQWQADLADMSKLSKFNDKHRYSLCIIDVFSKYACVVPIKYKTGKTFVIAFKSVLKNGRSPKSLQTDKGTEFKNKEFQIFLKTKKIHFFTTENPETKEHCQTYPKNFENSHVEIYVFHTSSHFEICRHSSQISTWLQSHLSSKY